MKQSSESQKIPRESRRSFGEDALRLILRVILSLALLVGGLHLLALRIVSWDVILGIPMVIISLVFIIYTYDDVLTKHLGDGEDDYEDENENDNHNHKPHNRDSENNG